MGEAGHKSCARTRPATVLFVSMMLQCVAANAVGARRCRVASCFAAGNVRSMGRQRTARNLSDRSDGDCLPITKVGIVGGGLAGMSAAYHLLDVARSEKKGMHITVFDSCNVGEGGASAVAGGLIHPFSPRGKLIHNGKHALKCSTRLIEAAAKHRPDCILRPHLYRVALTDKNVEQLKHTVKNYPTLAAWMSREEMQDAFGVDSLGGLKLGGGCKVIHVPFYLQGLWEECERKADEMDGSVQWEVAPVTANDNDDQLSQFDAVVLSAGAGILHDQFVDSNKLPVQLVRGQSVEMSLPGSDATTNEAFLCGKYVSPLPQLDASSQRFVIGATHEFKSEAFDPEEVLEELKGRSYPLAPSLWDNGSVDRLTTGFRMQSHRGAFGRMPIIGRYNSNCNDGMMRHRNAWIFTGLSSRGLIYHGLFGSWLADAILHDDEERVRSHFAEVDWWRREPNKPTL
ncbi:hypothetical protein ACHAXT_007910, partial [Thalassiosira profunda]